MSATETRRPLSPSSSPGGVHRHAETGAYPAASRAPSGLERISRMATRGFLALFALFLLASLAFGVYATRHSDTVYSGVSVAGIDASGMDRDTLQRALSDKVDAYSSQTIEVTAGEQVFQASTEEIGATIDIEATVKKALATGRDGTWLERSSHWTRFAVQGEDVAPVVHIDATQFQAYLDSIVPQVEYAPQDARVDMTGGEEPALVDDVPGQSIDVIGTRNAVVHHASTLSDAPLAVSLSSIPAAVRADDVAHGLPDAQRYVSQPMTLHASEGTWELDQEQLRSLVSVDEAGAVEIDRLEVQRFVSRLAAEVDRPASDAGVQLGDDGKFSVVSSMDSATVDVNATTDSLIAALDGGNSDVDVTVQRGSPTISNEAAQSAADEANALVDGGMTLTWSGDDITLGRGDLAQALIISAHPDEEVQFTMAFDEEVMYERLAPAADVVDLPARDARFRLLDGRVRLVTEERSGRAVDVDASVDEAIGVLNDGDGEGSLVVNTVEPEITQEDGRDIELNDMLGDSWTYYGNSSDARRQNVERSAELENGWLVPPGGVFSFGEVAGEITEENGFVTGFGIVGEPEGGVTTAPVIGGGICQVSTTIFQAAWWAGLSIVERYEHPYWLESYGEAPRGMRGLDAMVYLEGPWVSDLKFENTTDDWIALVVTADGEQVRAEIRGVDQGWDVDVRQPVITNVEQPDAERIYTESEELPRGEELQVETAMEGFDASIQRIVRDSDGQVIEDKTLESSFLASRNTTLRGTGPED